MCVWFALLSIAVFTVLVHPRFSRNMRFILTLCVTERALLLLGERLFLIMPCRLVIMLGLGRLCLKPMLARRKFLVPVL